MWPDFSRVPASSLPTRPQPTTTTCTHLLEARCTSRCLRADAGRSRHGSDADGCSGQASSGPAIVRKRWRSSSGSWSAGRSRRPSRSTSASRRRSRSPSSRPTPSRRRRTRPRRSSSSPRVGASSLALGLDVLVPIAIAVAILLAIVVTSYRQTIFAYPSGGGSYVVSRENLGENPSLVAGASLLVDYILTVAVSISAGVAAIVSIPAFDGLAGPPRRARPRRSSRSSALANLRGVKESGRLFAVADLRLHRHARRADRRTACARSYFGDIDPVPFDPEALRGRAGRRAARSGCSSS